MITSTSGAHNGPPVGSRALVTAAALLGAASLAACGSKDFPNNPRPPAPLEVTAKIDQNRVVVSPNRFGSGLVTFTIANLSESPVRFTLSGPKDATTGEIQPNTPAYLKVLLPRGSYQASAGQGAHARPDTVDVRAKRGSSQNKLLLP